MIGQTERDEATRRGQEDLRTLPRATAVRFDSSLRRVEVELNIGYSISFPPERAQELANASSEQLAEVEIAGVGFGIYFPAIDVDLWVPSLAKGRFGNDRWEAAWLATHPLEERPAVRVHEEEEIATVDHTVAA